MDDPAPKDLYDVGTIATILQLLKLPDGTVKVLVEGVERATVEQLVAGDFFAAKTGDARRGRGLRRARDGRAGALGRHAVRAVREAQPQGAAGDPHLARRHRAAGAPRRHRRGAHVAQARRQAEDPRDPGRAPPPRAHPRAHRGRDGRAADREAHPRPRQAADGEEPARVLPQRADEGDPEGAGRDGRRAQRDRRAREEDRARRHAEGGEGEGDLRARQAQADVADVGRGHGGAQLRRLAGEGAVEQAHQGQARPRGRRADPGRGPLRAREGQGAHRRVPRGAAARAEAEGPDPVPRRSAGRGQDLARPVDRARHQPQVRAHVAGRRARRGRDPRPPPHLHRLDARQDRAEHGAHRGAQPAVPARRSRQDGDGLPRRPVVGAARGARPRAEPGVQRPLPRGGLRPLRGDVRLHREQPEHSGAAARPHGSHPAAGLHRGREVEHRPALPAAEAGQGERPRGATSSRSAIRRSSR